MWKNYLKVALRSIARQKAYSIINIAGLTAGLTACLLIAFYIKHEISFDRFHEKGDRIVRLATSMGDFGDNANTSPVAARRIADTSPDVEAMVRLLRERQTLRHEGELQIEERFYYADSSFFDVFSFALVDGDPTLALTAPGSVVLTAETAARYFGHEPAIGKTLVLNEGRPMEITGVVQNPPPQSHIQFDFLASMNTLGELGPWGQWVHAYLLLSEPEGSSRLQTALNRVTDIEDWETGRDDLMAAFGLAASGMAFRLQPLSRIHLHSDLMGELQPGGSARQLYAFALVALFVLCIACINYTNLATARFARRVKEIGVRKVVGAGRGQLVGQFVSESLVVTALALLPTLVLVTLLLPRFGTAVGRAITLNPDANLVLIVLGVVVLTSLLAGSYPAVYLARFRPINMLRSGDSFPTGVRLRSGLVVFQFGMAVALVSLTLGVREQLDFVRSKPLGYDIERIAQISLPNDVRAGGATIKAEMLRIPGVVNVSVASGMPGRGGLYTVIDHAGEKIRLHRFSADAAYLATMGISMATSSDLLQTDGGVVINETAARLLGHGRDEPGSDLLGSEIPWMGGGNTVSGIMEDFHIESLHSPIIPIMGTIDRDAAAGDALVMRLARQGEEETIHAMREVWQAYVPDVPFELAYIQDILAESYVNEQRLGDLFAAFSVLAIVIACLGIFGLAAYSTEQRTKEIGIRKVLGASVADVVGLISSDFLKPVVVGCVLALPPAYFALRKWLEAFAYRIEPSSGLFLTAALLTLSVVILAVMGQSVRAALANPVDSLRSE